MHEAAGGYPLDDFQGRHWRPESMPVSLKRTDENTAEIAALAALLGEPIGLDGLLDVLKWRLRRSLSGRLLGRAVDRSWRFDRYDQADPRWWPQGMACAPSSLSTSSLSTSSLAPGREVVATTWYSKPLATTSHGSRVTFADLRSRRYRHVLLVEPVLEGTRLIMKPLQIHAGGLAWVGHTLHVAATGRGIYTFDVRDVMRVADSHLSPEAFGISEDHQVHSYGHRYVLPVRTAWRASTHQGEAKLRYSFVSADTSSTPPILLAGEYGRGTQSTRITRFALDPTTGAPLTDDDGLARPLELDQRGEPQMQGVVRVAGRLYVSVSRGPWKPGTVLSGRPGAFRRFPRALPMGPEDLDHRPLDDTLWTVTEHPWRRWIVRVPRAWFERH